MSREGNWFYQTLDAVHELLYRMPTWVGPPAALLAYAFFRFLVPAIVTAFGGDAFKLLSRLSFDLAWIAPFSVLICWVLAIIRKWSNRRLLNRQTGLASLKALTWAQFEALVGEAFRRSGYTVVETGRSGPDGGVDLVLTNNGEETVVQCKRWKEWKVGVEKIRELYGIMAGRGSTNGIIVTSGAFTKAACDYAEGKSLQLIDGRALAKLVAEIKTDSSPPVIKQAIAPAESLLCPKCGSGMKLMTARIWGCDRFPECRGKRPHEAVS
jgi:restriction system protein